MAIAHVQSLSAQATTSVSSIATASITTTTGNMIHAGRSNFAATDAATPLTPDPGNGWVTQGLTTNAGAGGALKVGVARARNIIGATGTFTYSLTAADSPSITISEFSGLDQTTPVIFGPTARNNQTQANPHSSASLTNTGVSDALYVVSGADSANPPSYVASAPAGYTIATSKTDNANGQDIWTGYLIVSTIAARTLDTNISAGSVDDVTQVVIYQIAQAGAAVVDSVSTALRSPYRMLAPVAMLAGLIGRQGMGDGPSTVIQLVAGAADFALHPARQNRQGRMVNWTPPDFIVAAQVDQPNTWIAPSYSRMPRGRIVRIDPADGPPTVIRLVEGVTFVLRPAAPRQFGKVVNSPTTVDAVAAVVVGGESSVLVRPAYRGPTGPRLWQLVSWSLNADLTAVIPPPPAGGPDIIYLLESGRFAMKVDTDIYAEI